MALNPNPNPNPNPPGGRLVTPTPPVSTPSGPCRQEKYTSFWATRTCPASLRSLGRASRSRASPGPLSRTLLPSWVKPRSPLTSSRSCWPSDSTTGRTRPNLPPCVTCSAQSKWPAQPSLVPASSYPRLTSRAPSRTGSRITYGVSTNTSLRVARPSPPCPGTRLLLSGTGYIGRATRPLSFWTTGRTR